MQKHQSTLCFVGCAPCAMPGVFSHAIPPQTGTLGSQKRVPVCRANGPDGSNPQEGVATWEVGKGYGENGAGNVTDVAPCCVVARKEENRNLSLPTRQQHLHQAPTTSGCGTAYALPRLPPPAPRPRSPYLPSPRLVQVLQMGPEICGSRATSRTHTRRRILVVVTELPPKRQA